MPEEQPEAEMVTNRRAVMMIQRFRRDDQKGLWELLGEIGNGGQHRTVASFIALIELADQMATQLEPSNPDGFFDSLLMGIDMAEADHQANQRRPDEGEDEHR